MHELTHALGLQKHIDSPRKLDAILKKMEPDMGKRMEWVKRNISEYGAENYKETEAEAASLVLSPDYVRGTLPADVENHIYQLFNYKGA